MEMEDIPVETYSGLDDLAGGDEELQELIKSILNNKTTAPRPQQQLLTVHWSVLLVAIIFIFGTLGLFSYKLVQSLKDKERKREEKRKLKEMKKKK